jgi:predicted PurR-regulated permease PerM
MKTAPESLKSTTDRLTTVLSYGALLLLGYLVYAIFTPFLVPLAWSAVFAIFFYPLHESLERRMPPGRAALVSTVLVTVVLIVPAILVLLFTTRQAIDAMGEIQSALAVRGQGPNQGLLMRAQEWIRMKLPSALQTVNVSDSLRQAAEKVAAFLAGKSGAILKNLVTFFVDLFILVFALFFMFRDGQAIVRGVRHLLPFDEGIQKDMLEESRQLIFGSVAVGLVIAALQGSLGGLALAITGTPSAIFWGVVIAFASLIPVVGSALIWIPVALWLVLSGHWGKAVLVVAICGGVAGTVDNLIRPLLLKNRTRLNELLLFISVLGGLEVFGLLGLVVGPTVVAAAMAVFRVYMDQRDRSALAGKS